MLAFSHFEAGLPYDAFLARYGSDSHRARWKAVLDQVVLCDDQKELLTAFRRRTCVLVLAGAWCGDCSGQCPIFEQFARAQPLLDVRYLDRDEHAAVQKELQINGGNRVPVAVFFSEDGQEVSRYGERTLSRYRELMRQQAGEGCPTGIIRAGDPTLVKVTQDWLDEFERAQWILRLSPRLRQRHGD